MEITEQHKDYLLDNGWKVEDDHAVFTNGNKKMFGIYPESQDRYLITNIRDINSNNRTDTSETFIYYNRISKLEKWLPTINKTIKEL